MKTDKTISILGCGWLGLPLARHFIGQGYKVKGSSTNAAKLELLEKEGIAPYLVNVTDKTVEGDLQELLAETDILIINFPPKRIPDIEAVHPRQIGLVLEQVAPQQKVLFVSSTSVYQNTNEMVTEEMELHPEKASGKALVKAEELLQTRLGERLSILRLAGLVGYDRLPGRFLANKKDVKNGAAPINVIHQDDCIGLIVQLIAQQKWGEVYNGCADEHPLRRDYYTRAAEKIGLQPPHFAQGEPMAFKIVSNEKSKKDLGYTYQYPDPVQMLVL
jgi:nucleoside-diphosphate-sugar epimerase